MIWTDALLSQLQIDAAQDANKQVPCLYNKFYLPVTKGVSVYSLPANVRQILRVTWRGWKLDFVSFEEMKYLNPATVFVGQGNSANIETTRGRPYFFSVSPTAPYDIRLFPTPSETFGTGSDAYSPVANEPYCVVSCYQHVDTTFTDPTASLPPYIARRVMKAYVAWKAYSYEGKGQSDPGQKYYEKRYSFLIEQFRLINEVAYIGQRYGIGDGTETIDGFRPARPTYPANFERVVLR